MGLEDRPDQRAETAAPLVGVRVIEHKITTAGYLGKSKLDVLRVDKEALMAQDCQPSADRSSALAGRIYGMNDADSHEYSQSTE
jgi:hypothetical protein